MSVALLLAPAAGAVGAAGVAELLASLPAPRGGALRRRSVAWLARVGRRLGVVAPPGDLATRLAAAGSPLGLRPADAMALKSGAALLALPAALPVAASLPGRLPALAVVGAPLAGFLAPDAWLLARVRARADAMARELPDLLDLLRVAVEAGLGIERALAEVARRQRGALASEWGRASAELALGVPRPQVLAALSRRCPGEGMPAFIACLERAGRHGTPLAGTLAAQASDARAARARRIREHAARAAPKIQLVVALGLVPSAMLLVAAALANALLAAR